MENRKVIQYKNSAIAYRVYGLGSEAVFCLHGFSLSSIAYDGLGKRCPADKIMFAVDFPLHGETIWKEKEFGADDFLEIFRSIHQKELQKELSRFELMGHSMGGRICLYMYQCFPEKISKLILVAPDGLNKTTGHRLLFKTKIGPKLFRRMSNSAKLIMSVSTFFRRARIINRSVFNLVKSSYEDADTAHQVYERLMVSKNFYPHIKTIKEKIRQFKTPVFLFFGKYDAIVPYKLAAHLQKGEEQFVHVEILLSGHLLLANEETLPSIAAVL